MTKTIQLTDSQIEQVREVLYMQTARRVGYIAVVNFGFDPNSGERIIELSFACLEWDDAVAICRKIKKLAAALPPAELLAHPSPGKCNSLAREPSTAKGS